MKSYTVGIVLSLIATVCSAEPSANPLVGDADRGRLVFGACRTCHLLDKGAGNHNGPNLYAVFGRKAGTREGFLYYSDTLKKADFVWTPELLDLWLANPNTFLPDSTMIFAGIKDPQRRTDLIEYLKTFHD
jgi:cytochrome c